MKIHTGIKAAFVFYELLWKLAIPILSRNSRLKKGYRQRILKEKPPQADIWIQAASAGESFLACELIKNLNPLQPVRILLTSNTLQGFDILDCAARHVNENHEKIKAFTAYFPFDSPSLMQEAVSCIKPRVMILLETEIWPGLLLALKQHGSLVATINGRINPKSLRGYSVWPMLWKKLRPDRVLAISQDDANRFTKLFGGSGIDVMSNIKFDRIKVDSNVQDNEDLYEEKNQTENSIEKLFDPGIPFLVLASVREAEEPMIEQMILNIRQKASNPVIGLFPRHIHRTGHWKRALSRMNIPFTLRSEAGEKISSKTIILWDTFGELNAAYNLATAAFVGGSLVPLGGQNFLEPLICGISPIIGQSWEDFRWVGDQIFENGLVRIVADWKEAAALLIGDIKNPKPKHEIRKAALDYMNARRGGTLTACRMINELLDKK